MRRAISLLVLLALMGGFAFGVNRFLASRKTQLPNHVVAPSSTKPAFVLPGTMIVAQQGGLYRLSNGTFTDLHMPNKGTWMQPSPVPGTTRFVAVLRTDAYSEVYLVEDSGAVVAQLSQNQTASSTIQLNHWMFWPRVAADGQTFYVSYDAPKSTQSYEIEFAVWQGDLNGKLTKREITSPNAYTGGDVGGIPLADGTVLYSKYAIGNEQVFSQIAVQQRALARPVLLTDSADDCGQPALSPDGTQLAMICVGGTSLQSTRLVVASLSGTTLGAPRVLVSNCLCAAPAWAPDGSGLVYYAPADATGHFQMWWVAGAAGATPKAPRQVTTTLDFDATSPPAWTS